MFAFLKDHPFAVEAFFDYSVVLTFAFPKAQLEDLIPECLTLDTLNDQWAFVAVAVVQTKGLRPKGFPKFLGNDFVLTGYRIFVRYTSNEGKKLRGLYILKSETNKKLMELLGNLFTHYSYTTTDIKMSREHSQFNIISNQSNLNITFETEGEIALPAGSPFADWKEARKYAGPLPFTFTYDLKTKKILIIEGLRERWIPKAININHYHVPFLDSIGLKNGILANAFMITNIPYYWKKGRIEQWRP